MDRKDRYSRTIWIVNFQGEFMRRIIFIYYIFLLSCFGANWYEKNKSLSVVFHKDVWKYVEKANYFSDKGDIKSADLYLRKAKEKTEKCEPFTPSNWPNGWPMNKESLVYLKYATPTAFINRIIGDFCLENGYTKEAIIYFEAYLNKSIIPDADYYIKLAEIYEKEGMYNQALNLYNEIGKFIEGKNYWGKGYSSDFIEKKIKNINLLQKKNLIIVLLPVYIEVPAFVQEEFFNLFLNEVKNIKNVILIPRENFEKVLNEQKFVEKDIEDEELRVAGKILNADYILKPSLTKIIDTYILNIDVFSVDKKKWFEHYEYKIDDIKFIPNLIKRFVFNFQGLDIPPSLYLPETKFLWSYEADSLITDLKISKDGKRILIGTDTGSLYLFNEKGRLIKSFKFSEKVVTLGISPEGDYFSVFTLEGKIFLISGNGRILWSKKTGNYGRGISISENGKFMVFGIDNKLFYIDKNGEIFWDLVLPDTITSVNITDNTELIFIGTEKGSIFCYKDDGNLNWKKDIKEKIINIKSGVNYVTFESDKGKLYIYDISGNEVKNFRVDEEINFTVFNNEILELLCGKRGNFLYFFSNDKKSLWKYNLKERVSFLFSVPDGRNIYSVEGKNLFAFSIIWK
jgi:tetratricopeptide (TPR) repeat protein